ncbi:hypothetical protein C4K09_1012 [Pseudomonas chlororaphis subsp. aureofaciens]|nr:hypothetical protein C4K09_1012 [Pseudomonas chlororaphis subsp. aureofaciens]PWY51739.1 hypothetical protein DK261_06985 [Pseudomonas sp. RW409]
MLAMLVNDDAYRLIPCAALRFIASKLAPTESSRQRTGGLPYCLHRWSQIAQAPRIPRRLQETTSC